MASETGGRRATVGARRARADDPRRARADEPRRVRDAQRAVRRVSRSARAVRASTTPSSACSRPLFMVPHALATLPFGWAGDRFDRRRVIAVGLVLASVAGALGALAHELPRARADRARSSASAPPRSCRSRTRSSAQLYDGPRKASRMAIFNLGLFLGGVVGFGGGHRARLSGRRPRARDAGHRCSRS